MVDGVLLAMELHLVVELSDFLRPCRQRNVALQPPRVRRQRHRLRQGPLQVLPLAAALPNVDVIAVVALLRAAKVARVHHAAGTGSRSGLAVAH